jgi:putative peptide zinc metalloprotease protein
VRTQSGKQYQVSENAALLLRTINGNRNLAEIAQRYGEVSGQQCSSAEIRALVDEFLVPNGLIEMENAPPPSQGKSYLYFKVPLFSQQSLSPITKVLQVFFEKHVLILGALVIAGFHAYLYSFAPRSSFSLSKISLVDGLAIYGLMLMGTLIHELGHSSACRHFKAQHGSIGIGLYLYFFVFYADVSDAWRLKRSERAVIDLAGMYFQLLFIPLLYLAYVLSGFLGFLSAIYAMNLQVITCLNPFLRFDGYWLASDVLGVPNLRRRASEVVQYFVRRIARRQTLARPFILEVPFSYRLFLYGYALVSNAFFVVFASYVAFALIPDLLKDYPALLSAFYAQMQESVRRSDIGMLLAAFNKILAPTIMIVMVSLMFFGLFRNLSKLVFKKTVGATP